MAVLTTHKNLKQSFVGSRGTGSWIDHVAGLKPLVAECLQSLVTATRFVQPIQASIYVVDHRPNILSMPITLPILPVPKKCRRWDRSLIADSMQNGTNRENFLKTLQLSFVEHDAALKFYSRDNTPERHNKLFFEITQAAGFKYFH